MKPIITNPIKNILPVLLMLINALPVCVAQIPTVKYNFKKNQIDSVLPFDQRFNIQFTNVEEDIDSIFISFAEVSNTKKVLRNEFGPKRKWKDGDTLSSREFFKRSDYPVLQIRTTFDTSNEYVSVPYQLKYNRDYYISVSGQKSRILTVQEKDSLRKFLNEQMDERRTLNETIKELQEGDSGREINELLWRYQMKIKTMILSWNPGYSFSVRSKKELGELFITNQKLFRDFFDAYFNILDDLHEDQKDTFRNIDWQNIKPDDNTYNDFVRSNDLHIDNERLRNKIYSDFTIAVENSKEMMKIAQQMVKDVILSSLIEKKNISPTYHNSITENASLYTSVDLGYFYNPYLDKFMPSITLTLYPRPVNPNLPFSHYSGWDKLWTRIGIIAGTTLISVNEEGKRKGIIGNKALLLGAGYRFLPFAKISSGCIVFQADDPNPLVTQYSTKFRWYVGVSLDIDVAGLIKNTFINSY